MSKDGECLKDRKVHFNASGSGAMTYRIALPPSWIKEMGIEENDTIDLIFKNKEIIVSKHEK